MRKAYKTLTNYEYEVLSKVARKTGSDCWFVIKQDCHGTDYIYDWEQSKRMCLKTGVSILADSIDCQENFDNCCLEWNEKVTLRNLFKKLGINIGRSVDLGLPEFVGMSIDNFKKLIHSSERYDYQKCGDDHCVDGVIYQFDKYDKCFSIVESDY